MLSLIPAAGAQLQRDDVSALLQGGPSEAQARSADEGFASAAKDKFPGVTIDLGKLDGSDGFSIITTRVFSQLAYDVANAGDVNGDGLGDIIVGAPGDASIGPVGAAYVIFGKTSPFDASLDVASLNGGNGFKLLGGKDWTGMSVAGAGDVNGDGFDDMIVAAPQANAHGESYVVFGKAGGFDAVIDLTKLDGTDGFQILTSENSGILKVASAGDVNGDGFDDMMVGAALADPHGANSGATYVLFGKADGFQAVENVTQLDGGRGFELDGGFSELSAVSLDSAGDFNGDGYDDLIIGAPAASAGLAGQGASFVVFGKADGFTAVSDLADLDGTNGFRINGAVVSDSSGGSVASAGDFNGDGYDDLMVSANFAPGAPSSAGVVYVVFGSASGPGPSLDLSSIDGVNGFRMTGAFEDAAGWSVSSAGDVNGDGFADIIVGAHDTVSYVVFGKASGFPATLDLSKLSAEDGFRVLGGDNFRSGWKVSAAGDVNGDGLADIMIGNSDEHLSSYGGEAYVVFGNLPTEAVDRTGTAASQTLVGGAFDDRLAGLGGDDHLVGNGGADLLLGGAGNDTLDGGDGVDTASYADATDGVIVELSEAGAQATGGSGIDTLIGVENLIGSAFGDFLAGDDGDNVLIGGEGDDTLDGRGGFDTASYALETAGVTVSLDGSSPGAGPAGVDTLIDIEAVIGSAFGDSLTGSANADLLDGADGNDTLNGGGGDDTLVGGSGNDQLAGGAGVDTATYASAAAGVRVSLASATAQNTHGAGVDTLQLIENLTGSDFNDVLTGNGGANLLSGGSGDDLLSGGEGRDTLDGGDGVDTASFADAAAAIVLDLAHGTARGAGVDTLIGIERIVGSRFGDALTGDAAANTLTGGAGADTLQGAGGDDVLDGGVGLDAASYAGAASGVNVSLAIAGSQAAGGALGLDRLISIEALIGSRFADVLGGASSGDFSLSGGAGDDLLVFHDGGGARSLMDGGADDDTADFHLAGAEGWSFNLAKGSADDADGRQARLAGLENLIGSAHADSIIGSAGANRLDGGLDDDTVSGGKGDDTLSGGGGTDQLAGGKGADVFAFGLADANGSAGDLISDFEIGADKIDLTAFDASFSFVKAFTGKAGQVVITKADGGNLVSIDLDGDKHADLVISVHDQHGALSQADFVV